MDRDSPAPVFAVKRKATCESQDRIGEYRPRIAARQPYRQILLEIGIAAVVRMTEIILTREKKTVECPADEDQAEIE